MYSVLIVLDSYIIKSIHHEESEDPDQTGKMPGLIWVLAGLKDKIIGFVIQCLVYMLRKWDKICAYYQKTEKPKSKIKKKKINKW